MTLDLSVLALLVLVAFLSGWVLARRNPTTAVGAQADHLRRNYFRGLNYLLNEQPDKAIEVFLQIAEIDKQTVETHLALGNLFRRRGETDRAIRVHQNLIARANLTSEQKSLALLELGEDYMRAGLLDRAETLFTDLVGIDAHAPAASRHLIAICQQERDWKRAIEHARHLQTITGESQAELVSQFLSELAEHAVAKQDAIQAKAYLTEAVTVAPLSVRPRLIEGRLAHERQDWVRAANAYERAVENDIEYLPIALAPLLDALEHLDRRESIDAMLDEWMRRYPGISPVIKMTRRVRERDGDQAAIRFLAERLRKKPSVRGLSELVELQLAGLQGAAREQLEQLRDLLKQLLDGQALFRCSRCGFGARSHHWQCPGCKSWSTIKPVHGIAGN